MSPRRPYLEGVIVEELHRFLRQVAGTALRVEDLADVLKLSRHVRVDQGHLQRRVDGQVLHELAIGELVGQLPQPGELVLLAAPRQAVGPD